LVDVRPSLPESEQHPLTERQAAGEESLLGFDSLRVWWAGSRGDSRVVWKRIESMLAIEDREAFLIALRKTEGVQKSEFRDGPFLGPVEAASEADGRQYLRVEVRRLHDRADEAEWLRATLIPDPERPGGFAWIELELPRWLLEQGQ
jgi:hypothetical protein